MIQLRFIILCRWWLGLVISRGSIISYLMILCQFEILRLIYNDFPFFLVLSPRWRSLQDTVKLKVTHGLSALIQQIQTVLQSHLLTWVNLGLSAGKIRFLLNKSISKLSFLVFNDLPNPLDIGLDHLFIILLKGFLNILLYWLCINDWICLCSHLTVLILEFL